MASPIGELLIKLSADVSGLASGARQAVSALATVDESTKRTAKEAARLREEFRKVIAAEAITGAVARVSQAFQQSEGALKGFGQSLGSLGQVFQSSMQGGLNGFIVSGIGAGLEAIVREYEAVQKDAKDAADAARAGHEAAAASAESWRQKIDEVAHAIQAAARAVKSGMGEAFESTAIDIEHLEKSAGMVDDTIERLTKRIAGLQAERNRSAAIASASGEDGFLGGGKFASRRDELDDQIGMLTRALSQAKEQQSVLSPQLSALYGQQTIASLAKDRADQMHGMQRTLSLSGEQVGLTGGFGAGLADIAHLKAELANWKGPADEARSFREALDDAARGMRQAADAARRQGDAVVRNYLGQQRIDQSIRDIGARNRGQLAIDEGTTSPHGRYMLGLADQRKQEAAAQQDADAWLEFQHRLAGMAEAAKNAAAAQQETLRHHIDDFSDGLAGSMRETVAALKNKVGDNLSAGAADALNSDNAFENLGMSLAQSVGGAMQGIVMGFKEGGITGAIVGALTSSKQMKAVMSLLGSTFQALADGVGLVLRPLGPLFVMLDMVAKGLSPIVGILQPLIELLSGPLFLVFKGLGLGLAYMTRGIAWVVNQVLEFVAWVVGKFSSDAAAAVRAVEFNLGELDKGIDDMKNMTFAKAMNAFDDVTNAAKDVADALYNLPAGFKVERARFDASDADAHDRGPGTTVVQGDVNIDAASGDRNFWANVLRNNAMTRGSPIAVTYDYVLPITAVGG